MHIAEFIEEFMNAVRADLEKAQKEKDDMWIKLPREGQEERIHNYITNYFERFERDENPVPWQSIAGYALIGWVRDNHPELFNT